MSTTEKTPEETSGSEVVGASVPVEVAALIKADAKAEDRTPSYVMRRILCAHYAKRAKAKKAA